MNHSDESSNSRASTDWLTGGGETGARASVRQRESAEELRRTQARLESALAAGLAGTFFWDIKNDRVITDENMRRYFSLPEKALTEGVPLEAVLPAVMAEDRPQAAAALTEAIEQTGVYQIEYRVHHSDGTIRWLSISGAVERDTGGAAAEMAGVVVDITERKHIENEIRLISRMPAENPNPVIRLTPDGHVLYANDAAAPLLDFWKWQSDQHLPNELQERVKEVFRSDTKQQMEIEFDGRTFSCTLAPVLEAGYVNVYGNDITERKQMEEALEIAADSLERQSRIFDTALSSITDFAYIFDKKGRFIYANQPLLNLLGIKLKEIVGKNFFDLNYPDDLAARLQRQIQHVFETGETVRDETPFTSPTGADGVYEYIFNPVTAADGSIESVAGSTRDVTERKQIVQALEESEKQIREVLESVKDGFFALDEDFRFFYVNGEAGNILDREPGELLGKTLWEEYPGTVGSMFEEVYRRVMSGGAAELFTAFYPDQGRWYEARVYPARNGISVYFSNVTERKQAEDDARFLSDLSEHIRLAENADHLLIDMAELTGQYLQLNRCYISESDEARNCWWVERDYHAGLPSIAGEYRISDYPSYIVNESRAGRMLIATDAKTDPRSADLYEAAYAPIGIRAHIVVPLLREGLWVASLVAAVNQPRQWQPREIALIETVAERIWLAVERLRAEQQLRRSHDTFLNLIEGAPFGVYLVDAQFRLAQVGAGAQQVFSNIRPLLDRDFAEVLRIIWPEPFASEAINLFRHTLETGEPYRSPSTIEHRNDIDALESYDWRIERITLPDDQYGVVCYFYDLSERQQAEAALRESEAEFRQLANTVPQIVWVADASGKLEYVNDQWVEFSGLTLAETDTPEVLTEILHPDDRERIFGEWTKAFESGTPYALEARMRNHKTGEYCWFLMRSEPTKDEAGNAVRWFGTSTDIHTQKQSEADARLLADVGEHIRLAEDAPTLMWEVVQAVGEHLQVSNAFFTEVEIERGTFQIHRDYHVGSRSFAGSYDRSAFGPALIRELSAGRVIVMRDATADPRVADSRDTYDQNGIRALVTVPLLRDEGQVSSLIVTTMRARDWTPREITLLETVAERTWLAVEKLRLDAQVHNANERFEVAESAAHGFVYEWNLANNTVERTDGFTELMGYNQDEIPANQSGWQALLHPDDLAFISSLTLDELATDDTYSIEYRAQHKDGHYIWVWDQGRIMQDEERRPVRVIGSTVDITDRKHKEEQIARLLKEEQQARAEAERATRLKDEFLGLVSHELRTPLNAISGWIKLMRGGRLSPDETAKAITTIERNAQSQNRLIEDLLDVSRVIAGKLKLEPQVIEPLTFIEAALDTARPAAEAKGIDLELLPSPQGIALNADPNRLQQAVWNLLSNAVKFTPAGGRVTIKQTRVDHHLEIAISDTGMGIAADFLPYVFDRFRQADATASRKYGGLGLGLAIVRHIVELHGGEVKADSEGEGRGATFTLKFPLAASAQTVETLAIPSTQSLELPPAIAARLYGLTVLAIDDEEADREMLKAVLNNYELRVVTASSVAEGLAAFQHAPFDALVCDIAMPGTDGFQFIRQVRELEAGQSRRIPAIALTAYARTEDRVRTLGAGFDSHVSKPVEPVELAIVLATLVERAAK